MRPETTKDIIIFKDENDQKISQVVDIILITEGYVTFKNLSDNNITIPINRVLKIKRRSE